MIYDTGALNYMNRNCFLTIALLVCANAAYADAFFSGNGASSSFGIYDGSPSGIIHNTPSNKSSIIFQSVKQKPVAATQEVHETFTTSIQEYKAILDINPNDIKTRIHYALALDILGNYNESAKEIETVIKLAEKNKNILSGLQDIMQSKIAESPKNMTYHLLLGEIYDNLDMQNEAVVEYKTVLKNEPGSKKAKYNLACTYMNLKDYNQALPLLTSLLSIDPYYTEARLKKAECLWNQEKKEAAINEYKSAYQYDSDNNSTKIALYKVLKETMSKEKVIVTLYPEYKTKAINDAAYVKIASDLKSEKMIDDAVFFYKQALEINPDNPDAQIDLADIYNKSNQKDEAQKLLDNAQKSLTNEDELKKKYNTVVAETSENPLNEALELIKNGLYDDAINVYKSISPQTVDILICIANCYIYQKKYDEAINNLNKALILEPQNSDIYYTFGLLNVNQDDYTKAEEYLAKSLNLNPNNQKSKNLLTQINKNKNNKLIEMAYHNFDIQNYDEALRLINEVLKTAKDDPDLLYDKALMYYAKHMYAEEVEILKKIIQIKPDFSLAYYSLGVAYELLSNPKAALASFNKFLSFDNEESDYTKHARERLDALNK